MAVELNLAEHIVTLAAVSWKGRVVNHRYREWVYVLLGLHETAKLGASEDTMMILIFES